MAFDYDQHKNSHGKGEEWVAFSDLYLCLSTVFLFLFVVASLRSGATSVQAQAEVQKLAREAEDLKQQIKVYNNLQQDYLAKDASQSEAEVYKELMAKLDLLQDEADTEKNDLRKQAAEHEKKEMALNKYQQLVRNIINSNMLSQARIKRRDKVIDVKNDVITEKTEEISDLEQDVAQKRQAIEQGERKIASMNGELSTRMKQLKKSFENNKMTKKAYEAQQAKLKNEIAVRVSALKQQNAQVSTQLQQVAGELSAREQALAQAQSTIVQKDQKIAEKEQLAGQLQADLRGAAEKAAKDRASMKAAFDAEQGRLRGEFENQLRAEKLSAGQLAAREAAYRAGEADRAAKFKADADALAGRLRAEAAAREGNLKAQAAAREGQLQAEAAAREGQLRGQAEAQKQALGNQIAGLASKVKDTEGELAKARELANARKKLADQIRQNFAKAGIKADVDAGTGDVILDFGDTYFESGRADLKPKMRDQLERAMPVYSASLFSDPKVAQKIQGIEIIGFASPTYKGKVVDPGSLAEGDRKAVDYNLDLSYSRAKSIFNYVFDTKKMQFKHQRDLLPLVKVTGRSFLGEAKENRGVAGSPGKDYCSNNDCKKAQRVIIKFNLGE